MINITNEEKEKCKYDPSFLREVLERELDKAKNDLVISGSKDNFSKIQGRALALHDIIKLLH